MAEKGLLPALLGSLTEGAVFEFGEFAASKALEALGNRHQFVRGAVSKSGGERAHTMGQELAATADALNTVQNGEVKIEEDITASEMQNTLLMHTNNYNDAHEQLQHRHDQLHFLFERGAGSRQCQWLRPDHRDQ